MAVKTKRCAVYTRKSTERGLEQNFNSLDAQREACAAYIKSQVHDGWELLDKYYDDGGISGGTMERPSLKRLLKDVEAGRVDVIVVYKIDRLTRSLLDFTRIVEICDRNGASFVSVTQQFNTTTSMGRLTLNVLLSFAQFEREVTSERILDKIAASKKKGMWMGGPPPLGYDIINRHLFINREEAADVEHIFRSYLKHGSMKGFVDELAAKGIRNKCWKNRNGEMRGGAELASGSIYRILHNPIYIGKVRHGKLTYKGEHEAILDKKLWDSVQKTLDEKAVARKENHDSPNILTGKIFDDAGNQMSPSYGKRNGKITQRYYVSRATMNGNKHLAGSIPRIRADLADEIVLKALRDEFELTRSAATSLARKELERVEICSDGVLIEIPGNDASGAPRRLKVQIDLTKPGHAKKIVGIKTHHGGGESLLKATAQAMYWLKELDQGRITHVRELAEIGGFSERYVWKILRLAFLVPEVIDTAAGGRSNADLSLSTVNQVALPADWMAQVRCVLHVD